jgi:hypothetical protein
LNTELVMHNRTLVALTLLAVNTVIQPAFGQTSLGETEALGLVRKWSTETCISIYPSSEFTFGSNGTTSIIFPSSRITLRGTPEAILDNFNALEGVGVYQNVRLIRIAGKPELHYEVRKDIPAGILQKSRAGWDCMKIMIPPQEIASISVEAAKGGSTSPGWPGAIVHFTISGPLTAAYVKYMQLQKRLVSDARKMRILYRLNERGAWFAAGADITTIDGTFTTNNVADALNQE